ncbi:uncharacterized protein [Haliotis asinina]|uniref:uncharacterized protein n=1 Tax=Haliotis asinina TaxID=109174 RepID=UPI0035320507
MKKVATIHEDTETDSCTDGSSSGEYIIVRKLEEAALLAEQKRKKLAAEEPVWRENVRRQMEEELDRRVRDALETPPLERIKRRKEEARKRQHKELEKINSHILLDISKDRDFFKSKQWRALQARQNNRNMTQHNNRIEFVFRDELSRSNQDEFPGVFGLESFSEGIKNIREEFSNSVERFPPLKPKIRQFYTKQGFLQAMKSGHLPDGFTFLDDKGTYRDKYGVIRNQDGPFWPLDCLPLYATPRFRYFDMKAEPLSYQLPVVTRTAENQDTPFHGRWRGVLIVYDSERSPREHHAQPVPEGCCPNLLFESRFESGNLRQARRVGQYEYELVLKTDLYTNRHTQWYYFRVKNAVPGITYKFRIVNLLKRDSLYNYGMRPLGYSEQNARDRKTGWYRTGHHISYSRNVTYLHCPLLQRNIAYYYLEWQMEFPHAEDTYYLAHCYPYTFTDLKEDLDTLLQDPEREQFMRREVLCETRAGNSCFLITVTNFEHTTPGVRKKAVVVSARVHPGESQASWMMKGLLDFVTSSHPVAEKLRNSVIFKIVPMLNPDGVIVGNYRCSLAARDLNRNYRHPRCESFPTIWYVKNMVDMLMQRHEVLLYCDLHGHSRKHNVFMYGNNTSTEEDVSQYGAARTFINERLFPWLMSQKSPDKFSYPSCKFHIRKCKESTGRVVMWRQMKIQNSFTLEATFSGTILDSGRSRHFNISDFMDMGKTLGQVVLDYMELQQNKARQTEVVLDLTRVITQDILVSRGLLPQDTKIPSFTDMAMLRQDSNLSEVEAEMIQEDAEKWTGVILSLVAKDREKSSLEDKQDKGKKEDKKDLKGVKPENGKEPALTRKEIDQLIDNMSLKTMDGCLNILTELSVRDAITESDSSDSDSESEPEMKESKTRKKKRKSRKQRDRDKKTPTPAEKKEDSRMKVLSASLPALVCVPESHHGSHHQLPSGSLPSQSHSSPLYRTRQANAALDKYMRMATRPHYISKYEGRSNGGVPCFTEERSIERQAKRMAEIKKKTEEDRQKDLSFFFVDGRNAPGQPPLASPDDIHHRLQVALNEGTSNISQALVGFNIRTGYTHADNFRDLCPGVHSTNGFILPSTSLTNGLSNGHLVNGTKDLSSSDDSDSEAGDVATPIRTFPVSSRRNPYQLDHVSNPLTFPLPPPVFRKPVRTGPVLKTVNRHMVNSTPPLIASGIIPPRRSSVTSELTNQKLDDRTRITRSSGPLIGSLRSNGVHQGFN